MRTRKTKGALRRLIKNWAVPVGCGLLSLFLLRFVFFVGYVPSASMEPAIRKDSFIIGVRVFGDPSVGDAVAFRHDGMLLVKRIAALPGDTVTVGEERLIVPDGCYFTLGDNADISVDSRYWAEPFVRGEQIVAKLLLP
ncbi:MAG: S26 family signal peptidase [Gracilibacteraceae bacterium]|jgi:signal peptidase I|nr:S26 family signal peptidase [Gracilibacteraceae bacterium]